jgi:ADP-heptose:LPS heptosyltransferase
MRKLKNTSLICVDCFSYGSAVAAIKKSIEQMQFERILFLTDIPIKIDGIEVIQIPTIRSKREYSNFIIKQLYQHIPDDCDYFCLIQADGYIIDGTQWDDKYFDYDYIGASWIFDDDRQVGNGGSSFRTKRLHKILAEDEMISVLHPEDHSICIIYKFYLEEKYGVRFAPVELADKYSYELKTPIAPTFSFHGNFHPHYMPTVVIIRKAALGDVVQCEPVMQYFYDKGYRVVLDTLPQFHLLFINHYFKVHRLQEVDQRLLQTAKYVNLDGVYEAEPTMNHLEAYFKYTGEPYEEYKEYLKRPQLNLGFSLTQDTKLFKKQAVIHYDLRGQNGRNIFGVDWDKIAAYLISKGYIVLQVGNGEHKPIKGVHEINITNENFLCYVIGSADLFIGCDSGPSNIAVGFNVPSVIFFGMVESSIIHYDLSNIFVIDNGDTCELPKCWHKAGVGATAGMKCIVDEKKPPCVQFTTGEVIRTIDKIIVNGKI